MSHLSEMRIDLQGKLIASVLIENNYETIKQYVSSINFKDDGTVLNQREIWACFEKLSKTKKIFEIRDLELLLNINYTRKQFFQLTSLPSEPFIGKVCLKLLEVDITEKLISKFEQSMKNINPTDFETLNYSYLQIKDLKENEKLDIIHFLEDNYIYLSENQQINCEWYFDFHSSFHAKVAKIKDQNNLQEHSISFLNYIEQNQSSSNNQIVLAEVINKLSFYPRLNQDIKLQKVIDKLPKYTGI